MQSIGDRSLDCRRLPSILLPPLEFVGLQLVPFLPVLHLVMHLEWQWMKSDWGVEAHAGCWSGGL